MGYPTRSSSIAPQPDGGLALGSRADPVFPHVVAWSVEGVRATFLKRGELVPPPSPDVRRVAGERYAVVAAELAAASRARSTRQTYARHIEHWLVWAEKRGVCPLPADPASLQAYLLDFALSADALGTPGRGESGEFVGRVAMVTVTQMMAALGRLHLLAGLPSPAADPQVKALMAGLRRTLTNAPVYAKAALTWDLLLKTLEPAAEPTAPSLVRAQTAIALSREAGATAGQLARLLWSDVSLESDAAWVMLAPGHRRAASRRCILACDGQAVALLRRLRDVSAHRPGTAVFRDATGKPLTRQGLHKILTRGCDSTVEASAPVSSVAAVRDRALLLAGWLTALRRNNLAMLTWDELTRTPNGWHVLVERSKTDQTGAGTTVAITHAPPGSGMPDPAGALDDWRALMTQVLGRDPQSLPRVPVFVRVSKHDQVFLDERGRPAGLSGGAISDIVKRRVRAAGLDHGVHLTHGGRRTAPGRAPFSAHSLRAGFVTEGLARGVPAELLRAQTGHTSRAFEIYYRPATAPDLLAATAVMAAVTDGRPETDGSPAPRRRRPTWSTYG